ncbi:TetR family transcriptional regulator C-terminal domain-containing protein [Lichenicoccus sp.]|uniref:TetR/AcrR family transcriptional regulator n=1 Tax=Lichenicoccus sp. TaxID=2781899 RepID=UPI003D15198C
MARTSNREKILTEGLRVVHERGFANASVRDIVQAAGVPQGSFTNHFASKEAFGLEIIDLYDAAGRALGARTLLNEALPPLQRLHAWLQAGRESMAACSMRNGCLLGNFAADACEQSGSIRRRVLAAFSELQASVACCLRAAVAAGEIDAQLDCDDVAGFIVASLQGANLLAKVTGEAAPLDRFERLLFERILPAPRSS